MTEQMYLDRKGAAKLAGVGVDTITRAIKSGKLRAKRSGIDDDGKPTGLGKYLITREALADWYEQLEDAG